MSSPGTEEIINASLHAWGAEVLAILAARIQARRLVLTGGLLESLQYQVLEAASDATGRLLLSFQESGRIKDMRAVTRRRMAPISEIEDFVRKVGLARFRRVPGYGPGSKRLPTESVAVNRIAWGIARAQLARQQHKPKKWFSKPFYSTINALVDRLLDGHAGAATQALKQELEGGSNG